MNRTVFLTLGGSETVSSVVGAAKMMETKITAKVAYRFGTVALVLSLIPVLLMGLAHLARQIGYEQVRSALAPAAFLAQAGFALLNLWLLSPLVVIFGLAAVVGVARSGGASRGIGLALTGIGMVAVADVVAYVTVNQWAR